MATFDLQHTTKDNVKLACSEEELALSNLNLLRTRSSPRSGNNLRVARGPLIVPRYELYPILISVVPEGFSYNKIYNAYF